ncbi:MAG: ATP-binding cassette domain-containing protein [Moraxella sp.]|nr:ATP-binding cassette domain-containing protein [Moraxella sp.]
MMKVFKPKLFTLSQLITPVLPLWLIAWGLGLVTVLSILGLLMVSGWFITMSAWAGLVAAGSHGFNYLAPSAIIRTFAISRTAGRYGDLLVSHQAIFELLKNLRVRFFNEFAKLPASIRRTIDSSDSQYRLVKDIDILDEFVLKFISPWISALGAMAAVFAVIALWYGAWIWLFALMIVGAAIMAVRAGIGMAVDESVLLQDRKTKLIDTLPALTQLLIWGQWQNQLHEFHAKDTAVIDFYHRQQTLRQYALVMVQWLIAFVVLVLLWVAMTQFVNDIWAVNAANIAYLLAAVLGAFGLSEMLMTLVAEPLAYGRSLNAKNRLNALLGMTDDVPKVNAPNDFVLILDKLITRQPKALQDLPAVNTMVKQGVPMLITGVSGGGKSTLLDTIAGEIEPIGGQIVAQAAGEPIPWHTIDWQGELGYLGQRIDIFDQSLADNLRLGKPAATDDELMAVLDSVGLGEWVRGERLGLATALGEYGAAVSGGQARRIALARLLLSPKKVLLLDEPFAGLDDNSRYRLWHSLVQHQKDGLLLIVTHHDWRDVGEVDRLRIGG